LKIEKVFVSLRALSKNEQHSNNKTKFCATCASMATQEALFSVEGVSLIERYCDICAKTVHS
jgi:hypothetical protein